MFITVDWDYFLPIKPEWDLSTQENGLFLDFIWITRVEVKPLMKLDEYKNFWSLVRNNTGELPNVCFVSESHCDAGPLIPREERLVILFDAHHDCWPNPSPDEIQAENWAESWLKSNPDNKLIWVKPEHSPFDLWGANPKIKKQIKTLTFDKALKLLGLAPVSRVHICRSGCWCPPWFDQDFRKFVKSYGKIQLTRKVKKPFDGYALRWNDKHYKQLVSFKDLLDNHRNSLVI